MLTKLTRNISSLLFARGKLRTFARVHPQLCLEHLEDREVPAITIQFDYSYDTSGFFTSNVRNVLQQAATDIGSQIATNLSAIVPSGSDTWTETFYRPDTGALESLPGPALPSNTVTVYVGSRSLGGPAGVGGFGAYNSAGSSNWQTSLSSRGPNLPLFGGSSFLWGGSLAFDTTSTNWWFNSSISGISGSQVDFFSVASHELGHLFGLGTSQSWFSQISGGSFIGSNSQAVYGGPVPVDGSTAHWSNMVMVAGKKALMDQSLNTGTRVNASPLDLAALKDIGWSLTWKQLNAGNFTQSIVNSRGDVFVESSAGVFEIPAGASYNAAIPLNSGYFPLIAADANGNLFVGSSAGVFKILAGASYNQATQLNGGSFSLMAADANGDVFVGSSAGVFKIPAGASYNQATQLNSGTFSQMIANSRGDVFVESSSGVFKIPAGSSFNQATQLNSGYFPLMAADSNGNLFVGSSAGVFKILAGASNNQATQINGGSFAYLAVNAGGDVFVGSSAGMFKIPVGSANNFAIPIYGPPAYNSPSWLGVDATGHVFAQFSSGGIWQQN